MTQFKMRQKTIRLRPYWRYLTVRFTNDIQGALRREGMDQPGWGAWFSKDGLNYEITLDYRAGESLVLHECTHVILTLFNDVCAVGSVDQLRDQEPFTYQLQDLFYEVRQLQKEVRSHFKSGNKKKF